MSKTVRMTTEFMPKNQLTLENWHPIYFEMTGRTPCYHEFMSLMTCLQNKKSSCSKKYSELLECLKKQGF